jgi:dTDP-4-amino-4,6-dideoxygalactose transaminase
MILCANPHAQYLAHRAEIDTAIHRVLERGRYILGEEVKAFEKEFADYIGVPHGIGVGSGTEALHLALASCGIGPGDEVITVSHTAVATVAAIELSGAQPVFIDVESGTGTMDPRRLEEAISPRTRAILPVHLYGQPADLDPILQVARARQLRVIEDCAQAHGATYRGRRVGSLGDAACFSFYPTKNLGALGDGGMAVTGRADVAERARLLREYGWKERYISHLAGWNSRLDELQAAVLRIKLRFLDEDNRRRNTLAARYDEALASLNVVRPLCREGGTHVHHLYVVRVSDRDRVQSFLKQRGVHTLVHYPAPIHRQPAYDGRIRVAGPLTETERLSREVLSLPMFPELTPDEVTTVVTALRDCGLAPIPENP